MTITIICPGKDSQSWYKALKSIDSSLEIEIWSNQTNRDNVEFALCWQPPKGVLASCSNLKCICSMGAGVDHLYSDPELPLEIPIVRIVDDSLAQSMYEYVCAVSLYYLRDLDVFDTQASQSQWQPKKSKAMANTSIGIMGLGALGSYVATKLLSIGFKVVGWSRSKKMIEGMETYQNDELDLFLKQVDTLVCLLPLTDKTRGILNIELFNKLPIGATVINVARGGHLVENDLLLALSEGHLRGACLDVFSTEPLPKGHPFWQNEKILVTPHCSSITDPVAVAPQIIENYRLMKAGKTLNNEVDVKRGY